MQFDHLKRREFITLLGGGAVAWPLAARAQQPAMPVVGFLRDATAAGSEFMVNGLRKGLAEGAWTDGQSERLSALAAELVGRHVHAYRAIYRTALRPLRWVLEGLTYED